MDAYNHVNNTAYLRYLEEGRARMLGFERAGGRGIDPSGLVIASIEIAYRRPLVFRLEPVEVRSAVTRTGRASFDIAQRICDADAVYAKATSTMVMIDPATARSRPIGDEELQWLERCSADDADDARGPR